MVDGDDAVVTLPRPVGKLTYDEWHSALLALVPGWLAGYGLLIGEGRVVFYALLALVATAGVLRVRGIPKIGPALANAGITVKRACPSLASKAGGTIRREPWYFLTVLAGVAAVTYGVGSWPWL